MENSSGTANRRRVKMGFISNVWSLKTVLDGGAESTQHFGVNTYNSAVTFAGAVSGITNLTTTGNITAGGNVSGSSTSTGSFGKLLGDGSGITGLTAPAITTYNSAADNRIITSVDSSTVQGESNLTFNGGSLVNASSGTQIKINTSNI